MSERDIIQVIKDKRTSTVTLEEAKQAQLPRNPDEAQTKEMRARVVRILERGFTNERLQVQLPDDMWGEWVEKDDAEILRMKDLGYHIDTEYAKNRVLHSDADGTLKTGSVIFMVTPKWNKDLIDEIKHKRFMDTHFPKKKKGDKSSQGEEESFANEVHNKLDMPVIEESSVKEVRAQEIVDVLSRKS